MFESFILVDRQTLANCGLVVDDPHEEDGRERHPDRDDRNWLNISERARLLVSGEESPGNTEVVVDERDAAIVESWKNEPPRLTINNVGDGLAVCNGRHRMFAIWSADPMLRIPVEVSPPFSAIGDDDPGQSLLAVEVLKKWETLIRNGVLNLPECRLNHRFVKKLHEVISKGYRVPEVLPDYISLTNVSNWRSVATGSYAQKLFIRKLGDSTLLVYDTSIAVWGDTVMAKVMPLVRKIWGREDYPMECKLLWREMKIGRERWVVSILKLDKGKWRYDISETVSADDYRWGLKLKWGVLELGAVDLGVEIRKGGST